MEIEARKLLEDVRQAATLIARFVSARSFDDYTSDVLLRSGVERQFEIIGEALVRLTRAAPSVADQLSNVPRAIAFRNALVHGYDAVNDRTVWDIIQTHLPPLQRDVEALLRSEDP